MAFFAGCNYGSWGAAALASFRALCSGALQRAERKHVQCVPDTLRRNIRVRRQCAVRSLSHSAAVRDQYPIHKIKGWLWGASSSLILLAKYKRPREHYHHYHWSSTVYFTTPHTYTYKRKGRFLVHTSDEMLQCFPQSAPTTLIQLWCNSRLSLCNQGETWENVNFFCSIF